MVTIYALFLTKMAQNPYPLVLHIPTCIYTIAYMYVAEYPQEWGGGGGGKTNCVRQRLVFFNDTYGFLLV